MKAAAIPSGPSWLVVDPASETVAVKMASQPLPVDDALDKDNLAFFEWLFAAA